jgi:hypothetical protein
VASGVTSIDAIISTNWANPLSRRKTTTRADLCLYVRPADGGSGRATCVPSTGPVCRALGRGGVDQPVGADPSTTASARSRGRMMSTTPLSA